MPEDKKISKMLIEEYIYVVWTQFLQIPFWALGSKKS